MLMALTTFSIYYLAASGNTYNIGTVLADPFQGNSTVQSSWIPVKTDVFTKYLLVIVNAWIIGSLLFFLHFSGGYLYLKYLIKKSNLENGQLNKSLKKLNKKFKIHRSIIIKESNMISSPFVMGYLKPVILFPIGLVNRLSTSEVESILAHELGHIKRHDYLFKLVQSFAEIIFYYHPGIWYISAQISYSRELCCDDLAIACTGNSVSYARALVKLQEMKNNVFSPALSISGNKSQFTNRILRLLDMPVASNNFRQRLLAFLLIFSAVFVFAKGDDETQQIQKPADIYVIDDCPHDIDNIGHYLDTIPEKTSFHIKKHSDEEELEMEMKNGSITKLRINGDDIPKEELNNYEDLIREFRHKKDRHAITIFPDCEKDFGNIFFLDKDNMEAYKMDSLIKKIEKKNYFFPEKELAEMEAALRFQDFDKFWVDSLRKDIEKEIADNRFFRNDNNIDSIMDLLPKGLKDMKRYLPDVYSGLSKIEDQHNSLRKYSKEESEILRRLSPHRKDLFEDEARILKHMNEDLLHLGHKGKVDLFEFVPQTASDVILHSLLKDELIEAGEKTKVELSGKQMKINGEKQPSNIWKKYKRIYEEETGLELTKKSKMEFELSAKSRRESYIRKLI
jgi:beta-lactamase regulating signal transducer with metallopeptidase domain